MKEKIKRLAKDRKFQVGVAVGLASALLIGESSVRSTAKQGFMTVRPICLDTGEWLFQDRKGELFGVEQLAK